MAFLGGLGWAAAWLGLVVGTCAALDALKFDASRISASLAQAAAATSLMVAVWLWKLGFWRAWSRHKVTHDEKWACCADVRPCRCNLPRVCLSAGCSCEKQHACADPRCQCARPKVCTSAKCKCALPKAFTFGGKSTYAQ